MKALLGAAAKAPANEFTGQVVGRARFGDQMFAIMAGGEGRAVAGGTSAVTFERAGGGTTSNQLSMVNMLDSAALREGRVGTDFELTRQLWATRPMQGEVRYAPKEMDVTIFHPAARELSDAGGHPNIPLGAATLKAPGATFKVSESSTAGAQRELVEQLRANAK